MKKILFLLVILMTAVSTASARTNNDLSFSSSTVLPTFQPGETMLRAADGDIIYATVREALSYTSIIFERPVSVGTIKFSKRFPVESHNYTMGYTARSFMLPFVTCAADWTITVITNDGKKYQGVVTLNGPTSWGGDPIPYDIIK